MLRVRDEEFFLHEKTENRMHKERHYSGDYNDGEMELYSRYKDQNMVIQLKKFKSLWVSNQSINTLLFNSSVFTLLFLSLFFSHGPARMKKFQFTAMSSARKL